SMASLTERIQPINTWLTLGSWVAWFAVVVTGLTGAAIMAWLSAQIVWFWEALGLFGVISIGLVVWTLLTATLVLYRGHIGTWRSKVGVVLIAFAVVFFLIGIVLVA